MSRSDRMFEIIQLLRSADAPLTAQAMAGTLEVTRRTVYRDVAALMAMNVPVEGEAGVGYIMRPGFDLPPLMFSAEEVEAITVALALLGRTGDDSLLAAAESAAQKIASVLPPAVRRSFDRPSVHASRWHDLPAALVDAGALRDAIRDEAKLQIVYRDSAGKRSKRTIKPVAVVYYVDTVVLAAWCELRNDFRHFSLAGIVSCKPSGGYFKGRGDALRTAWETTRKTK